MYVEAHQMFGWDKRSRQKRRPAAVLPEGFDLWHAWFDVGRETNRRRKIFRLRQGVWRLAPGLLIRVVQASVND